MRPQAGMVATRRRDIADIAYGFMGSKALFAALEIGVFTALADGPRTVDDLAAGFALEPPRVTTLLRALAGLGLVSEEAGGFRNSPAAQRHLVRGRDRQQAPHRDSATVLHQRRDVELELLLAAVDEHARHLDAAVAPGSGSVVTVVVAAATPFVALPVPVAPAVPVIGAVALTGVSATTKPSGWTGAAPSWPSRKPRSGPAKAGKSPSSSATKIKSRLPMRARFHWFD